MKLNYCPECKAILTKQNNTDYLCANGHNLWDNPRAAVTAIILKDGQVLCAKRGVNPSKGKYDLPGGFLNYGERAEDGIKREITEETGLKIDQLELIESYTHNYDEHTSVCDLLFLIHKWHGNMQAQDDVETLHWMSASIIDSPDFAWDYPGLTTKLGELL